MGATGGHGRSPGVGLTYSAEFNIVLRQKALGALHVGVAPAQSANCFIDVLRYTLPLSCLTGTLSFKESLALPDGGPEATLLRPEVELTYKRLAEYGFDPSAGLRLALDTIRAS